MQEAKKVFLLAGSTTEPSVTKSTLKMIEKALNEAGTEVVTLDLSLIDLPIFKVKASRPLVLKDYDEALVSSHSVVVATPDYHGSMAGSVKNWMDYYWQEFAGKLFGYVVSSHEKGLTVIDQMRTAVRQCYGWSLPYGVSVTESDFDEARETLLSSTLRLRVDCMVHDILDYGPLLQEQFIKNKGQRGFATRYK
ncbi:MAG: hypothetical protein COT74_03600 [Bdellovibrionales bacterium CG10_big_fil_rev_8_21_14_0_10_45_34]|nr:MAG: hypothetical protein COT74_03600 [Bdellovibrionales bacterium CG10_big_fil_rev_8_21_14_0_10_45_34]